MTFIQQDHLKKKLPSHPLPQVYVHLLYPLSAVTFCASIYMTLAVSLTLTLIFEITIHLVLTVLAASSEARREGGNGCI